MQVARLGGLAICSPTLCGPAGGNSICLFNPTANPLTTEVEGPSPISGRPSPTNIHTENATYDTQTRKKKQKKNEKTRPASPYFLV